MFSPGMFSPEQQQFIQEVQKFTKYIHATISRDADKVIVTLETTNPQANEFLPKIQNAMIASIAQSLHILFGILGKVK